MSFVNEFSSYEELFGELDFTKGEDARSVYSPAAYLADLLQLLDDNFETSNDDKSDFDDRRKDIRNIFLNQENTFNILPYLDIVNELLENKVGADAYSVLKEANYPFNLPFDLENEKVKQLLRFANVRPETIYKLFALKVDPDLVAREYLGLSQIEYDLYLKELQVDANYLKSHFNIIIPDNAPESDKNPFLKITDVSTFLKSTGLSGTELRELLFQNLSKKAKDDNGLTESVMARDFFINHNLGGYVGLDDNEENLEWKADNGSIPPAWFDRVNRFVRLAHKIKLSFSDLDLILRSCCNNKLNDKAIKTIAVIKETHDKFEIPIDEICGFYSNINILGIGEDEEPTDLFNRIFNSNFTKIEKSYIPASTFISSDYESKGYTALTCRGDILSLENKPFRRRLQKSLGISEKNLKYVVEQYRRGMSSDVEQTEDQAVSATVDTHNSLLDFNQEGEIGLEALSLLFRTTKLAEVLDISYQELFNLFDLLEKDSSIRNFAAFNLLINFSPITERNCYKIMESRDISHSQWLVQTLFAVVSWMQQYDFTAEELKQIITGNFPNEKAAQAAQNNKIDSLNSLYQQFREVVLKKDSFVSERFDERSSRVIYETTLKTDQSVVSKKDQRLINFNATNARTTALLALNQMPIITKEDFKGLGIEEKMLDKVYNNLIIKGYLRPDGTLKEEDFPKNIADFHINDSSTEEGAEVFGLIHDLYKKVSGKEPETDSPFQATNGHEEPIDLAVYLSNFEALDLSEIRRMEIYDNLIFNGYIDENGNVINTKFFADQSNLESFEPNANIDQHSKLVYDLIQASINRFEKEKLVLAPDIFSELPITDIEKNDLIENLQYNGYIDKERCFINKQQILDLKMKDFLLALQFYPYQRDIFKAIQNRISQFKAKYFVFKKEVFKDIADEMVAKLTYESLKNDFFPDGPIADEQIDFFFETENVKNFEIDTYFTDIYTSVVFQHIANIIDSAMVYQLDYTILNELGFDNSEADDIFNFLQKNGYLTADFKIPDNQIPYFLNINNAIEFEVEGYEDYNKDIFFELNAIAVETENSVSEITERFKLLAEDQNSVLFSALQETFELNADILEVIFEHVFRQPQNLVEEFMLPILNSVSDDELVVNQPQSNKFNLAYKRIQQFAVLANKLGLSKEETDVIFKDQDLVEKYPENLVLPEGIDHIDALLEDYKKQTYLFHNQNYWVYDSKTYNLLEGPKPLHDISPKFKNVSQVDAAFTDEEGCTWIISGNQYFCNEKATDHWESREKVFGLIENNFDDPMRIDASFIDKEGKTYLFSGDQYIRYSNSYESIDQGYPKKIKGNWANELNFRLPNAYYNSIEASFQGLDGKTYIFKDNKFVCSDDYKLEKDINTIWGKVNNNFEGAKKIDAILALSDSIVIFAGNQLARYSNALENNKLLLDEGSLHKLDSAKSAEWKFPITKELEDGIDAAFKGYDNQIYITKNDKSYSFGEGNSVLEESLYLKWGSVRNNILITGKIDAAFAGLDGRTYIFSGDQYYRYSGNDYSEVDEGYPKTIATDWVGLTTVDAAFVLDGKTYLFGTKKPISEATDETPTNSFENFYIRYSSNDYTNPDESYPKSPKDNWWNLPEKLLKAGFDTPDAVFIGMEGQTYLFSKNKFVAYESKHRWWSEPKNLKTQWDSIPFESVSAAFTGKDGRTYLFSGNEKITELTDEDMISFEVASSRLNPNAPKFEFIRYSDNQYDKIDDRFPKIITEHWGKVTNNIEKMKKVDAAVVLESYETETDEQGNSTEKTSMHTYLFSGDQFFRYTGAKYDWIDEGYPKNIQKSLKNEPRFKNIKCKLESGIDAAFADQRNVYLFTKNKFHVISDSLYKEYSNHIAPGVQSIFMDGDSVYIERENQWNHFGNLEMPKLYNNKTNPSILREVPITFTSEIDTILHGTDRNTYIFKGKECFNVAMDKSYPYAEEWGRVKNNVYINNKIDTAFVGRDGNTYLFSGNQFMVYKTAEGSTQFPKYIDGLPKPISKHWGGLNNVDLAFVRDDKTYLLEKADDEGNFRYVRYSSDDYSKPDDGFPQSADIYWWEFPTAYMEEGFEKVDAVLFEKDNVFLINGKQFIQYSKDEDLWTYPRPVERIWRDFPFNEINFENIVCAFKAKDDTLYFFSDEAFVPFKNGTFDKKPMTIKDHWGIIDNDFTNDETENRIDAAFVFENKTTYIFSGDQYVKYSTPDYRFVDDGYPKAILKNLRKEAPFKNLPDTFESRMEIIFNPSNTETGGFQAILSNERNIYIIENNNCHAVSKSLTADYKLKRIGKLKNNIEKSNKVEAAFVHEDQTFLFSGDQYIRYSGSEYNHVDEGYPKAIASNFTAEKGISEKFTGIFEYNIDAALKGSDGHIYLFKDKNFHQSVPASMISKNEPMPINSFWGNTRNIFISKDESANVSIDSAFISAMGHFYVFKDGQYIRYSKSTNKYMDEGFPKAIKDNWGNLPVNFEQSIDGGFVFEGKTYLSKGDEYVRYSDVNHKTIDVIYPEKFTNRWGDYSDYLLGDIQTISRFKHLSEDYGTSDYNLTDFFYDRVGYRKMPFKMLSEIFEWDIDDLKWMKRNNAFLREENHFEVDFDIETILKIYDTMLVTKKMGTYPEELYQKVWLPRYSQPETNKNALVNPTEVSGKLYQFLGMANSEKDWEVLKRQIHSELNVLRRNALVPYAIFKEPLANDARDLYKLMLIDVEMGDEATTSKIKEAISAVQLYFHRYFLSLENLDVRGSRDDARRRELKRWWKWIKNYRVWEANRKVFLYPENYIRPELRDTKTPAFEIMEEDLMQGEMNESAVSRIYKKYLDRYTEVSRLAISGGFVHNDPEKVYDKKLVLLGRTKTEPWIYYYRTASFVQGSTNSVQWEPWKELNIQINAKNVYPVYAFGRIFVFWAALETEEEPMNHKSGSMNVKEGSGGDQNIKNTSQHFSYVLRIYYSFFNLNKEWAPPQRLDKSIPFDIDSQEVKEFEQLRNTKEKQLSIRSDLPIFNFKLYVENSNKLNDQNAENQSSEHENIIIKCNYATFIFDWSKIPFVFLRNFDKSFILTPELYAKPTDKPFPAQTGKEVFKTIFDEPSINEDEVVMLNTKETSSDGPWFSFEHKGGSFLCKPAVNGLGNDHNPRSLQDNEADPLPKWNKIDAAFHTPKGKNYFFKGTKFTSSDNLKKEEDISSRWGLTPNNIAENGKVDAAINNGKNTLLFSGNEYLSYTNGSTYNFAEKDHPKAISKLKLFPASWKKVDAAFKGKDGKQYFFNGNKFSEGSTKTFEISSKWGLGKNTFNNPTSNEATPVNAAFVFGNNTFLINKDEYIKYTGKNYDTIAEGYPKTSSLFNILTELGCTNNDESFKGNTITAAYTQGNVVVLISNNKKYTFKGAKVSKPSISKSEQAAFFWQGTLYRFGQSSLNLGNRTIPLNRKIDASFIGKDGLLYAFSGKEFIAIQPAVLFNLMADITVNLFFNTLWQQNKQDVHKKWGQAVVNTFSNGIDAAWFDGTKTFLVKGDSYIVYSGKNYDFIDEGYPKKLKDNTDGLPKWDKIDAILNGSDNQVYFFATKRTRGQFTTSANLEKLQDTNEKWGKVSNNFVTKGISAAVVAKGTNQKNKLYLFSDHELLTYSIDANGNIGKFSDQKIPEKLSSGVNAAYSYDQNIYLFNNANYAKFINKTISTPKPIKGNWGNLPYPFNQNLDATLNTSDYLYFFKGDNYIRYNLKEENTIVPYEIYDVKFDVIRLTTSTGYKLNEILFTGGISALLSLNTQQIDETPSFVKIGNGSNKVVDPKHESTTIKARPDRVNQIPVTSHLDFNSANGIYYWEMFFHAPFLIAQTLNTAQKFDEAKMWYEYIFDPTESRQYWKFMPFLAQDIRAIIKTGKQSFQRILDLPLKATEKTLVKNAEKALNPILESLEPYISAFQGLEKLTEQQVNALESADRLSKLKTSRDLIEKMKISSIKREEITEFNYLKNNLLELTHLIGSLKSRYQMMETTDAELQAYLNDPFDPHAIAHLRKISYRKSIVMSYIDNLLDWGDMLFRQYTIESINEARMLYVLAYDLLGKKPESLGTKVLSADKNYNQIKSSDFEYELLLKLENQMAASDGEMSAVAPETAVENTETPLTELATVTDVPPSSINDSIISDYFFIPENSLFLDYWNRVEDRLYKIRQSLNILGIKQPLPLFQPPIDPMAIVQAVGAGASLSQALTGGSVAVPHYRFMFMLNKAKELVQKLSQFSGELLSALEKKDAEELQIMQTQQEGQILAMMQLIKKAQLEEAEHHLKSLEESLKSAELRLTNYENLISLGMLAEENKQIDMSSTGADLMLASSIIKMVSGAANLVPSTKIGLFNFGIEFGGVNIGEFVEKIGESLETLGDGTSMRGEAIGITAQFLRTKGDWEFEKQIAESDIKQINSQLEGSKLQVQMAKHEIAILEKEVQFNEEIGNFLKKKYTNVQLYQWMASKLSGLYYQTYKLAHDMAKAAEKGFQYERGLKESDVNFIKPVYWNSQRKGLLAGESLSLDLDRMEKAYIDTNSRRFEITKNISLVNLDPLAFLDLKNKGMCEFNLSEAMFDYDFQGHYCRQVKTIALSFDIGDGQTVMATLTQLNHRTIIEPDPKAVKFLLQPKDTEPLSIRSNWKAQQQIALSAHDEYEKNNGLFELRFDDERYLPFEGTGAVSRWRLQLNGKKGSYNINQLNDVIINLKYTALQGGEAFASAVKSMLKPYPTIRLFDFNFDFSDEWNQFLESDADELTLKLTRDLFPNMGSSKISGIYTKYEFLNGGKASIVLNNDDALTLKDGQYVDSSGLSISSKGTEFTFKFKGDKDQLTNVNLVMGYKATVN